MRETSYISNFYIVDIQVFGFSKCAKSSAFSETSYTTALEANFFTLRSNFQSTKRPCIIQIADHCKLLPELFGSILSIKCRDSMDGTFKLMWTPKYSKTFPNIFSIIFYSVSSSGWRWFFIYLLRSKGRSAPGRAAFPWEVFHKCI